MSQGNNFTDFLSGKSREPVIFEPFVNRRLVTQLIWRGGDNLWDTPTHMTKTLIDFYSYIKSDVVIIEPDGALDEVLTAAQLPAKTALVIVSDDPDELALAERSDKVCALATRGEYLKTAKPLILLATDGEPPEATIARSDRFSAVYLRERAEDFVGERVLLGGIGCDKLSTLGPLEIYERVKSLASLGVAIGSGGLGEYIEYLGFISMLGMYNKLK